jgi:hypothetical protein
MVMKVSPGVGSNVFTSNQIEQYEQGSYNPTPLTK